MSQKGIHFVLFFALGMALYNSLNLARPWQIGLSVGICFLAGMGSEGLQQLFPGRHASLWDVLLNGFSGTLAVGFSLVSDLLRTRAFIPAPRGAGRDMADLADD